MAKGDRVCIDGHMFTGEQPSSVVVVGHSWNGPRPASNCSDCHVSMHKYVTLPSSLKKMRRATTPASFSRAASHSSSQQATVACSSWSHPASLDPLTFPIQPSPPSQPACFLLFPAAPPSSLTLVDSRNRRCSPSPTTARPTAHAHCESPAFTSSSFSLPLVSQA